MSSPAKYSFIIDQGATMDWGFQYTDSTGSVINLSNYGAKLQIRPAPSSSTLYLTLSSSLNSDSTGINFSGSKSQTPTSPASGNVGIYLSAVSSSQLNFDKAEYDLFIFSASFSEKVLEGKVQLIKRITIAP